MSRTMCAHVQVGIGFALALATVACGDTRTPAPDQGVPAGVETPADDERLIPHTAVYERILELPRDPRTDPLPDDEYTAAQIRLGYDIVRNAREQAPEYVGNQLTCASCHLNGGQRERALPFVGVAATFPQYRARDGRLISLQDRIGDCFERSLNGTRPPEDSPEMMAVAAYVTWLSEGQPMLRNPEWRGLNRISAESLVPIAQLDVTLGQQLYQTQCLACHGPDGQGMHLGEPTPGPLWGPGSWNDGAGAARIYTLAGYIRYAMPLTAPGTISDSDAQHIAAYINSHERPAFARKAQDYPNGDTPVDAVYYPQVYERNPLIRQR